MASILPLAVTQFLNQDGVPLAGGKVYFYIPGTTTPKDTWRDSGQTILNTNPVILDAAGEAIIYGSGTYRQQVFDVDGNLIWDQLTGGTGSSGPSAGTVTGSQTISEAGTYLLNISSSVTITLPSAPSAGDVFQFKDIGGTLSPTVSATISAPSIDGQPSYVMNFPWQSNSFYYNGSAYSVL